MYKYKRKHVRNLLNEINTCEGNTYVLSNDILEVGTNA